MSMTAAALLCLQEATYYEARSEPEPAQFAVVEATMRRVEDWRWEDDPCGVVYYPGHYEWAKAKPNRKAEEAVNWALSGDIVGIVLEYGPSATKCSDHWHDISETPWWADHMEFEVQIGRMRFYCSNEDDWRKR